SGGRMSRARLCKQPTRSGPDNSTKDSVAAARAASADSIQLRACSANASARDVGASAAFLLRTKRGAPSSFSNCAIAIDVADCEAWQRCAALVIERVSSTARKYSICRSVSSIINSPDTGDQRNQLVSYCVTDHT